METKPLFPSIGSLADQADQETESAQAPGTTEDKVIQQIESLCMKCGEQVRKPY